MTRSVTHPDFKTGTIVLLTTVHPRFDVRVYFKEAQSLASNLPHKVLLMVADGKGSTGEIQCGVSIHDLGKLGSGRLSRVLGGTWKAFFAILRVRPVVVHFHDPELVPLGILLRAIGFKVIYDVHESFPSLAYSRDWVPGILRKPVYWVVVCAQRSGAACFNAIVAATSTIGKEFPTDKTVVVQNFPISGELDVPATASYIERPPSLIYVGGISKHRGAVRMVRAFELLGNAHCERLDFVGSTVTDSFAGELRALAGGLAVHFHGELTRAQVGLALAAARAGLVVLEPLPNHLESQPNKLFEYMSAGLPVIASDFPLWRRLIDQEGGCGILVDPLDTNAIAAAMRWILEHPAEAEAMGQRGRDLVDRKYNWKNEEATLMGLYKRLLAS